MLAIPWHACSWLCPVCCISACGIPCLKVEGHFILAILEKISGVLSPSNPILNSVFYFSAKISEQLWFSLTQSTKPLEEAGFFVVGTPYPRSGEVIHSLDFFYIYLSPPLRPAGSRHQIVSFARLMWTPGYAAETRLRWPRQNLRPCMGIAEKLEKNTVLSTQA